MPALAQYMREHPDEKVYLSYFGSAFPSAYGADVEMVPGFARVLAGPAYRAYNAQTPPPGTYAISATSIQLGLVHEEKYRGVCKNPCPQQDAMPQQNATADLPG